MENKIIEIFGKRAVVHVANKKQCRHVQKILFQYGYTWAHCGKKTTVDPVNQYRKDTCINFSDTYLAYAFTTWYKARNYTIISYEDFLDGLGFVGKDKLEPVIYW